MNFLHPNAFLAVLIVSALGCSPKERSDRPVEDLSAVESTVPGNEPQTQQTADEGPAPGSLVELDQLLETVAKIRRDGNDQIIEVDLRGKEVGGVIDQLDQLPKLRSVLLAQSTVTDDGLEAVGRISTLENLDLRECAIGDQGLSYLGKLNRLKSIKLSGKGGTTRVSDAGLDSISGLQSLKVIALDFLPVTDEGLQSISGLSQMRELYLADPETMLGILRGASGDCVAIVGHNPGVGDLAGQLVNTPPARTDFRRYPTLSTLILDFAVDDWSGIAPGTGKVIDFIVPRDLTD